MENASKSTAENTALLTPSALLRLFTEHPRAAGETYMQHFVFTAKLGARLFYSSMALWLHGIFPFVCTRTASKQIEYMYGIMKSRLPQNGPEPSTDNGWYWYI